MRRFRWEEWATSAASFNLVWAAVYDVDCYMDAFALATQAAMVTSKIRIGIVATDRLRAWKSRSRSSGFANATANSCAPGFSKPAGCRAIPNRLAGEKQKASQYPSIHSPHTIGRM
jgi:hypothetical protein